MSLILYSIHNKRYNYEIFDFQYSEKRFGNKPTISYWVWAGRFEIRVRPTRTHMMTHNIFLKACQVQYSKVCFISKTIRGVADIKSELPKHLSRMISFNRHIYHYRQFISLNWTKHFVSKMGKPGSIRVRYKVQLRLNFVHFLRL